MKHLIISCLLLVSTNTFAAEMMKLNFPNEELVKILEAYSKAANQKIIIDPGVRGKITILNPAPVDLAEAFNQISTACAVNGYALVKQGDTYVVMQGRQAQRNSTEVTTERPSAKPERMVTYIITMKNTSVDRVQRELMSMFASRDGEYRLFTDKNQIVITDWASNLQRVDDVIKELDKPADPAVAKIVEAAKKERRGDHRGQEAMGPQPPKGPRKGKDGAPPPPAPIKE